MMDAYVDSQMKAIREFHRQRPKNNMYQPGTMCHRLYEQAWLKCIDSEIRQRVRDQDDLNDLREIVV